MPRTFRKTAKQKGRGDAKLRLSLIENACDFLNDTIKRANGDAAPDWKYAIISLSSALELIMKSILEKEHWSLLFQNIEAATRDSLIKGDFKSVDFETTQTRLQNIAGVGISVRDARYLRSVRNARNRVSHSEVDLNVDQIRAIVAHGILVFLDLYKAPHLSDQHDEQYEAQVNRSLIEFEKYVRLKMARLSKEIATSQRPEPPFRGCGVCYQDAIVFAGESTCETRCLFCDEQADIEDIARDRSETPLQTCPECDEDTLAFVLYNNDDGEFVCARCGYKSQRVDECWECGATLVSSSGETICPSCWDYKVSRD